MSLFTSSQFASAAARGTDWRDTSKAVLEKLESIQSENTPFNVGFLYISDHLAEHAGSILNLFKSVLGIEDWVGATGVGICGSGEAFIDEPAISAMVGSFPKGDFCVFPAFSGQGEETRKALKPWLEKNSPMLTFVHGDPLAEEDPALALNRLSDFTQGFLIGGLSSSRRAQIQFARSEQNNGLSGIAFAQNVQVATSLSQGCVPVGKAHTITLGDEHLVMELDNQKAVHVFEQDLRNMAIERVGKDPDTIVVDRYEIEDLKDLENIAPKEFKSLMKGEIHVAFPIGESDQQDYLVRNIIGLDPDEGSIAVSQHITNGEALMFVHRDDDTVREDLSRALLELRKRIQHDTGSFAPKGGVYVSCAARASSVLQNRALGGNEGQDFSEVQLIRDIIGDIPLTGFYAGGEISNARLYGYTGVLTLFL